MGHPQSKSLLDLSRLPPSHEGEPEAATASVKRKRSSRATIACETCRKRKVRCDGDGVSSCLGCIKAAAPAQCVYIPSTHNNAPKAFRSLGKPPSNRTKQTPVESGPDFQVATSGKAARPPSQSSPATFTAQTNQSTGQTEHPDQEVIEHPESAQLHVDRAAAQLATMERETGADTAAGCGSVNQYTNGTEFYGNTGIFPFLARLKRYAQLQTKRPDQQQGTSIVSYLHNSDYAVPAATPPSTQSSHVARTAPTTGLPLVTPSPFEPSRTVPSICITLFFNNLHLVHPIFERHKFLERCKNEVWAGSDEEYDARPCGFRAVYYAVLALGAIVGSEDDFAFELRETSLEAAPDNVRFVSGQSPLSLAKHFFELSKANLGDIFDVSSSDTTQALFLLSVFCQNALKPHSCYLFSGMAARTAVAIGLPNAKYGQSGQDTEYLRTAALTWWCIYMHEVEMCCASGRDTSLKSPVHYDLPLPDDSRDNPADETSNTVIAFVSVTVSLANLLKRASEELYQSNSVNLRGRALVAADLDRALERWKDDLPPPLNYTKVSLTEPERVSRQKTVLKLRYFSARILFHRRFVEAWSTDPETCFEPEINKCLDAARNTIQLLFETYLHRPYFRTWWYNTTYLLNASMITLYVFFTGVHDVTASDLFQDIEKALEVFDAMGSIIVARRCAKLIREIYDTAKVVHETRSASSKAWQKVPSTRQANRIGADQVSFGDHQEEAIHPTLHRAGMQNELDNEATVSPTADINLDFGFSDAIWNLEDTTYMGFPSGESLQQYDFGYNGVLP